MDWGSPTFVLAIIAIATGGWIINNWIRARHGYPLENEWGGMTEKPENGQQKLLQAENRELKDQVEHMQDRLAVLERIVTDKGYTLSEEIEQLRKLDHAEPQGERTR